MRYHVFTFLVFVGALFQLTGCDQKQNKLVKISIHHRKAAGDTVKIVRSNMVNLDTIGLGSVILDSAGKGVVEFELDAPVLASAMAVHLTSALSISPGDELAIVPSKPGTKLSVSYEGDGAALNQVINESVQIWNGLGKWNGVYAFQLDKDEFLNAKDSLQRGYDQLLAKLKLEKEVSEEMIDLFARYSKMSVLFYQFNYAVGKDSSEIPASVRKVVENLPIDTIALKIGMPDYSMIAAQFYQHRIHNAVYEENEKMDADSLESIFPFLVEKKIKAAGYPKQIEDFMRAKSADIQIGMAGLSPQIMKLTGELEKEIISEDFKNVIREDVARWEKIGPGKPAPDFTGLTPDGKKLSLSDLRGKIVYVDIWATWCGYCIDEFPDSKKMEAEFKGNDQVAFLYVSVDSDTLAWKKMVAGGKVPNGLHMLNGADAPGSIWNLYHVWGIPRYLLIDAQGRMVATHAARPSSGDVQTELRKLLTVNRVAQK